MVASQSSYLQNIKYVKANIDNNLNYVIGKTNYLEKICHDDDMDEYDDDVEVVVAEDDDAEEEDEGLIYLTRKQPHSERQGKSLLLQGL